MVRRREIALYVILTIVTCGIFGLYWFVCLTNDTNYLVGDPGDTSGGLALLLVIVTCGIYGFYWAYKMGEKLDRLKNYRGINASNSSVLYLILYLVTGGVICYAVIQSELNKLV